MYEFIDSDGGRVTIRSARTLSHLLASGRIKAATRFRLADEPGFRPAGEHPSLVEIASQVGIRFGEAVPQTSATPSARPAQTLLQASALPASALPASALPASAPGAPLPEQSTPAAPVPNVVSADVARRKGSVPSTAEPVMAVSAARIGEPLAAPPRLQTGGDSVANPFGQGFVVFASLLGVVVLGSLAGAVAGGITTSEVIKWLVTVAGAAWFARLAGRRLAQRTPRFTRGQIGAGSVVFIAGCLLVRWPGVIVGLPACAVLWTTLGERRV